jgi:hypothetical protein
MNHQDIDRRSLMMHRIIAARMRAQRAADRRAVTDDSRGFQPTGGPTGVGVSQSDTGFWYLVSEIADALPMRIPVSLCDTNGLADFPWAEAHGYLPSPLCGENLFKIKTSNS